MSSYYVQSTVPVVKLFHKDSLANCYQIFSNDNSNVSGKNLQSYSFQKSVKSFSGSFSLAIKEDVLDSDELFMDKVQPLDIVQILEDGSSNKIDFMGVITKISYTADSSGFNRVINIEGSSVSHLLELLNLNTEITAMIITDSGLQTELENININLSTSESVEKELMSIYELFCKVVKQNVKLSNGSLINVISNCFGSDFFVFEKKLKFYLTLVSNFFSSDVVTYPEYIQGFLDQSVYEVFEVIENNKPKIKVRECPFDKDDWIKLPCMNVDPVILMSYSFSKSIDTVYTVFYSFVQGSDQDAEYYVRTGTTKEIADVPEKRELYGYKPLRANFVGYSPKYSFDKNKKDSIKETFTKLNKRLASWYGKLDEMLIGTVTVVRVKGIKLAAIGEKIKFLNGEFYVTGEDHQWKYGSSPKIIYHIERGGSYDGNGNFTQLKGFTKKLAELSNLNK